MLDNLGYHDFRSVKKTGRQIDIFAYHKVTSQHIICECKAYKEKLEGDHLTKFRGLYAIEYDKDKSLVGLFFSLSGFGGGFLELYREMDEDIKQRLKIFSDHDLYQLIEKSDMIVSEKTIRHLIKNKIPYEIRTLYLTITEYGEYWIITFGPKTKETHFTVLTAKGMEVQKYIIDELIKVDSQIKKLTPINLSARTKIIISLCDNYERTIDEISTEIEESSTDVEIEISTLIKKEIVLESKGKYRLSNELETFTTLSKEFLTSKNRTEYFRGVYAQGNIDSRLVNYIQTRFFIQFEDEQKKAIIKILKISPSAFLKSLTEPTEMFRTGYEQISEGSFPKEIKEKWETGSVSQLFSIFVKALISDLDDSDSSKILGDKEIRGCMLHIVAKFVSLSEKYLTFEVKSMFMMAKAKGEIKAGRLVSATHPSVFLDLAMILTQMEEYELALREYDKVLEDNNEPELLKVTWNNKGLVYATRGNFENAIECYKKSIEIGDGLKETYCNFGISLIGLGRNDEAKKFFKKALTLDRDYETAKKYLATLN